MRRYRMIMLAALLLPMLSFSAESFAELLKREISGFAKEYFELSKKSQERLSSLPFQERDDFLAKLDLSCYECGYEKKTGSYEESKSKEISEVLLRKYSGKIGDDEVSFFLQIDKDSHKILGGVVALPNEPMIPLKFLRILGDEKLGSKSIGIELSPNLELQVIFDRKLTTLSPQCPAQNLCSYVANSQTGIYFFPDLHIAIFDSGYENKLNMLEAKSYEEAKKILSYESSFTTERYSDSSLLVINDRYMSFKRNLQGIEVVLTTGAIFDIKTKQFLDLSFNIWKDSVTVPKSIYDKYELSVFCEDNGACDDTDGLEMEGDEYFDGFHRGYSYDVYIRGIRAPVNGDYDNPNAEWERTNGGFREYSFFIPLKELKPYIKPEWYNYLIGKGELPKLREKAKLPELP